MVRLRRRHARAHGKVCGKPVGALAIVLAFRRQIALDAQLLAVDMGNACDPERAAHRRPELDDARAGKGA